MTSSTLRAPAVVAAALTLLAACGSGSDDRGSAADTTTTTAGELGELGELVDDRAGSVGEALLAVTGDDALAQATGAAIDELVADMDAGVVAATPEQPLPADGGS